MKNSKKLQIGIIQKVASKTEEVKPTQKISKDPNKNLNSKVTKQIEEAITRMNIAAKSIQETKQALNVDLFLQKQKQKRANYAKQLNQQFENKKLEREKKLYNKKKEANVTTQLKSNTNNNAKYINQLPIITKKPKEVQSSIFILDTHSISKIKEFLETINLEELREEQQKLNQKCNWEMIQKLADSSNKLNFNEYSPIGEIIMKNDIFATLQSQNFLNILVLIANNSRLYKKIILFEQDINIPENKLFLFRLFHNGERKTVFTDNYIECEKLEYDLVPKFSHCHNKNRFWIPLFEKAYKKLYDWKTPKPSIHEVCRDFLNLDPEIIKISHEAIIKQNFLKVLYLLNKNNSLIGFYRYGQHNNSKASQGKVYPLRSIKLMNSEKNSKIQLINPWKKTSLLKEDGIDSLSLHQILENFNRIIIIKDYPKDWNCIKLNSFFFSFGIPSANNSEWTKNNQHLINIQKGCYVRIILKKYQQISSVHGFLLFKSQPDQIKITCMKLERLLVNAKSSQLNESSAFLFLQPGNYILIPYANERSYDKYMLFWFEIYYSKEEAISMGKTKYSDIRYKNISNQPEKIIAELEEIQKYDKPKTEKIMEAKEFRIMPDQLSQSELVQTKLYLQNQNVKIDTLLFPGNIHKFLVYDNIIVKETPLTNKKEEIRQDVSFNQANQAFKILIGTDAYSEEVNKDMMNDASEQLEQQIDLANYELTDEGFQKVIDYIVEQPKILSLNLQGNLLSNKSVILLCYQLQKSNHIELRKIILSNNNISEMGFNSLVGLKKRMKNLKEIVLEGNQQLTKQMIKSMK